MPHNYKFNTTMTKLQEIFSSDTTTTEIEENLTSIHNRFCTGRILNEVNKHKVKGYKLSNLLTALIFSVFFDVFSVLSLVKADNFSRSSKAEKDTFYRFLNNSNVNWRRMQYLYTKRFQDIVKKEQVECTTKNYRCLIIDDTTIEKTGKKIEHIGRVYDHVRHNSVLGFKALHLGLSDGKSFIPLDFTLQAELGKKKSKPYGLKPKEVKQRFNKKRKKDTHGFQRERELIIDKVSNTISMVNRVQKNGIEADYLLCDSWFMCEKLLKEYQDEQLRIIGQWKLNNQKVICNGREYSIKQLLKIHERKSIRSKKIKARYTELIVEYKEVRLKLYFAKFNGTNKWKAVVTTDLSLNFNKTMEIYSIRWSIEVFFKESKQLLKMGKIQSNDFDAQIARMTIAMMQYIMLSLKKRFSSYETIGGIFKNSKACLLEETITEKIWAFVIEIFCYLFELPGIDIDEVMKKIIRDQEYESRIVKIIRFLSEDIIGKNKKINQVA